MKAGASCVLDPALYAGTDHACRECPMYDRETSLCGATNTRVRPTEPLCPTGRMMVKGIVATFLANGSPDDVLVLQGGPLNVERKPEGGFFDVVEQEDGHAGIGEGDVRREDEGVPPLGTVEAAGQGDKDRGGTEEAQARELRAEGQEQVWKGKVE